MKKILSSGLLSALVYLVCSSVHAQTINKASASVISPKNITKTTIRNTQGKTVKWVASQENMPGNLKTFQENKGQFLNLLNDWKIEYGANCQETEVLFTNKGLIYYLPQKVEMTEAEADEWEKGKSEKEKELEEQHEKHYKTVYTKVGIEWENANPNPVIEAVDETPFYFGSVNPAPAAVFKGVDNIKGFRKLIYHDVYPGVDVEFTFHPTTGIKYAIHVKPGYDVSFKMKYSGQEGLALDADGNLHIKTLLGDILDHAPVTKQSGNTITSSFKQLTADEMTFQYASTDRSSELVIDPWLVSPTSGGYVPADCCMDAANNVYVLEWSGGKMYIQKYTALGALSWTYSCTQYGSQSSISDITCDPSGNTYTPQPYFFSNGHGGSYSMLSLNSSGIVNYFYNLYASGNIFETWGTGYSCYTGEVIESGSPTVTVEQVGIVTAATGVLTGPIYQNATISELYAADVAANGNLYCISSNLCFCTSGAEAFTNTLVGFNISGLTPVPLWSTVIPNYNFADFSFKNPAGVPNNGVGTSCQYVYTSDGVNLYQFNINTGANLGTATIPGGSNALGHANSGVAVDPISGWVYAGSQTTVEVYSSALVHDTTYSVPGIVYDLSFNNGVLSVCGATAANVGFVAQFNGQKAAAPPFIITDSSASCGRNDGTATVSSASFCVGPYTYLWAPGGQTTARVTGLSAGTYTVTVGTTSDCMSIVDSVKIGQSIGFTLTLTPVGINCKTGNITTTVSGGSNPYSYTWSNGATTANITGVAPGRYFVSVKDSAGCIDTASAIIPGSGLTATISITNPTCVATGTAIVNATGGATPYTYNWSNGATSSTNTGLTAGTYSITVTDNTGCAFVQLTTLTNPNPPTISVVPKKDSICSGLSISLTASGGKTYTWNPGALNGPTVIVSPLSTTTYTVVGTDTNGCIGKDSVTIKVLPAPTITVSPVNDSVCKGSSVTLTGSGGKTYVWNPVTGLNCDTCTSVLATPTVTTTWNIVGKGANGCKDSTTVTVKVLPIPIPTITVKPASDTICLGDSALLIAGGGGFYTWVFSGSPKDSIWVKPATSTIYTLQVDLDGCIATANKAIIVIGATVPKITVAKDSLCPGDSTSITASGGSSYKWLVPGNPTSATIWVKPASNSTYTVVVTTPCGKDTLVSKLIHVIPFPVITSSGNTSICIGSSTNLIVGGGTKYIWSPGGSTNSTISVNPIKTTTYTVVVSNGTCFKDTTITVTVDTPAVLTITPPSLLCIGDSMTLTATGGPSYKWSTGATTSSITVKPSTTTKYTCVVTKNGCIDSTSTLVTVDVPILNLCCGKTISPGGSDTIVASGSGNYVWTPNSSLSCDNCDTAIATPTVTTTYTVLSKDGAGCTITKMVTVYVEIPCADFMVPNVFTPNNDGRNDDFVINVLNPSSYSIDIYDRWGVIVYTSTDATVFWNGRLKGTQYLVSNGVYYYIIKASCGDNNYLKKGFVQVIGEQ